MARNAFILAQVLKPGFPPCCASKEGDNFGSDAHDLRKTHQEVHYIYNFDLAVPGTKAIVPHLPNQLGKLGGKGLAVVFDPGSSLCSGSSMINSKSLPAFARV